MDKLREYSRKGYKIVIFTNQKGSFQGKGGMSFDDFKNRWFNILECLKVPVYILAATHHDFYRKPSTSMWDFMEKNLNNNIKVIRKESLYVGDACGRSKDHSDSDLKFAFNIGVNFMTPEEFFENSNKFPVEQLKQEAEDNVHGFNPSIYLSSLNDIHKINHKSWESIQEIFENKKNRLMILVGSPASGKSTLSKLLEKKANEFSPITWKIHNLDQDGGTKKKFKTKISKLLSDTEEGCIIDCTNGTIELRKEWISLAKDINTEIGVICIFLNIIGFINKS